MDSTDLGQTKTKVGFRFLKNRALLQWKNEGAFPPIVHLEWVLRPSFFRKSLETGTESDFLFYLTGRIKVRFLQQCTNDWFKTNTLRETSTPYRLFYKRINNKNIDYFGATKFTHMNISVRYGKIFVQLCD